MRIAVNGIGVAGPTLAWWLREYGHQPVLFEKAAALRTGGYMIDFWGLGYEIAERMGLLPALGRRCYKMERMRMVGADGRQEASLDLRPMREMLDGRFISLARSDLSAALFEACEGIPAHFGNWVTGIDQDASGVVATLSDGRRESFDLVIGAGGLHSSVREQVFGPEAGFERSLGCYVAAFRIPGYPHRDELAFVSYTVPRRQVGRVSLRNDDTMVMLVFRDGLIDGFPPRNQQKAAIRRALGAMGWEVPAILDAMDRTDDLYFDRVSQIHMPRWTSGRVGLLGDAAACPSLLAGEGTGLAMTEAYVLAGELHRARGDFSRAFAAYEERLRDFVADKQKGAVGFRSFFAPRNRLALKVRNVAFSALSIPFFARRWLRRAVRDNFELPEYRAA